MTIHSSSDRFSTHRIAHKIAKTYGQQPQSIQVNMKGRKDVASLLNRVADAKNKAHAHPRTLD